MFSFFSYKWTCLQLPHNFWLIRWLSTFHFNATWLVQWFSISLSKTHFIFQLAKILHRVFFVLQSSAFGYSNLSIYFLTLPQWVPISSREFSSHATSYICCFQGCQTVDKLNLLLCLHSGSHFRFVITGTFALLLFILLTLCCYLSFFVTKFHFERSKPRHQYAVYTIPTNQYSWHRDRP